MNKKLKIVVGVLTVVFLIAWYGFFLTSKIDLTTSDLGRHIKNGEMLLAGNNKVLKTNFYSYTYADYPFINHHWLSSVIFFIVWEIGGFFGLHLFAVILCLFTFLIFFRMAQKETGALTAFFLSLLIVPLLAQRREIRPELFTNLFAGLFFWILWNFRQGKISSRYLLALPVIEILWLNSHIYFVLGILLIAAFLTERVILWLKMKIQKQTLEMKKLKTLALFLPATVIAGLVNPFGLKGLLHPFYVLNNYGYRILEAQSIWFLEGLGFIKNPNFFLFKIVFGLLCLSFILVLFKKRQKFCLIAFFLAVGFSFMAWLALRNLALFGLFALPIIAYNLKIILGEIKLKGPDAFIGAGVAAVVLLAIVFSTHSSLMPIQKNQFGLGLLPDNNKAAEFFKENNIQGPLFNNYDIGGYLIYHLFPEHGVFVDNRPEVYPAEFFHKVFVPMQEDEEMWQKQNEKYNFNAIFFSPQDATTWGQNFLIERVKDDNWAVVFFNQFSIIFLKKNELNKQTIEQYEIPKENFSIIQTR